MNKTHLQKELGISFISCYENTKKLYYEKKEFNFLINILKITKKLIEYYLPSLVISKIKPQSLNPWLVIVRALVVDV